MLDLFAPGAPQTFVLLVARIGGLVLVAPVFSTKNLPPMLKTAIIVLLTVLLHPMAMGRMTETPAITPATFVGETLVGFAIGLGAAILVAAAGLAGEMMGTQIGLSGAAVLDPVNNVSSNVLGQFTSLFAVTLLLAVDAHLVMIDAVARSLRLLPLGSALHADGLLAMTRSAGLLFALGLQFAAPVIAAVLIANVALAVLSRAAPQLNILSLAFPIQIGIGLTALSAAIPFIGAFYRSWSGVYLTLVNGSLSPLAHGVR